MGILFLLSVVVYILSAIAISILVVAGILGCIYIIKTKILPLFKKK